MEKTMDLRPSACACQPKPSCSFQQIEGAHDIRADERLGAEDAPVHMGLCREMDHPRRPRPLEQIHNSGRIADVSSDEAVPPSELKVNSFQVGKVSGVAQVINIDDPEI